MADQKPKPNPALRMLGLPNLPRKLPSRNWLIFWSVSTSLAAAIIYDRREKRRATARWAAAVAPLAHELLPTTSAMPRRVTVYLEAPPGDGLRSAQEHFKEYIKPVLASSGLDWEFVVGRRQGDVRAVVAERIRRSRRAEHLDLRPEEENHQKEEGKEGDGDIPTDDDIVETVRRRNGIPEYSGVKGDIVVGRHTWKEYVRGLHEGWLGPLTAPVAPAAAGVAATTGTATATTTTTSELAPEPAVAAAAAAPVPTTGAGATTTTTADADADADGIFAAPLQEGGDDDAATPSSPPATPETPPTPPPTEEPPTAPKRPPQPVPYNSVDDYPSSPLPRLIPAELGPSTAIPFPHLLGFLSTPTRLYRFLNRRATADAIGREVAAVCFATATREFKESSSSSSALDDGYEQQTVLAHEERDWVKTVWKDDARDLKEDPDLATRDKPWRSPMVVDPRIGNRMRRFELGPEEAAAARRIVVPEAEIEGWTKGKLRQLGRWAQRKWAGADRLRVDVGNVDDE